MKHVPHFISIKELSMDVWDAYEHSICICPTTLSFTASADALNERAENYADGPYIRLMCRQKASDDFAKSAFFMELVRKYCSDKVDDPDEKLVADIAWDFQKYGAIAYMASIMNNVTSYDEVLELYKSTSLVGNYLRGFYDKDSMSLLRRKIWMLVEMMSFVVSREYYAFGDSSGLPKPNYTQHDDIMQFYQEHIEDATIDDSIEDDVLDEVIYAFSSLIAFDRHISGMKCVIILRAAINVALDFGADFCAMSNSRRWLVIADITRMNLHTDGELGEACRAVYHLAMDKCRNNPPKNLVTRNPEKIDKLISRACKYVNVYDDDDCDDEDDDDSDDNLNM